MSQNLEDQNLESLVSQILEDQDLVVKPAYEPLDALIAINCMTRENFDEFLSSKEYDAIELLRGNAVQDGH
ncbi:hypothetical protein KCV07_g15, partial [Aureobasidium melanogenum]